MDFSLKHSFRDRLSILAMTMGVFFLFTINWNCNSESIYKKILCSLHSDTFEVDKNFLFLSNILPFNSNLVLFKCSFSKFSMVKIDLKGHCVVFVGAVIIVEYYVVSLIRCSVITYSNLLGVDQKMESFQIHLVHRSVV